MMQSLQQFARYEAYQDSGEEWLGDIPQGWELKKLKHVLNLVSVKESSLNSAKPYIGMENILSWSGKFISSEIEAEGLASSFQQGDILFGKLRPYLAKVYLCEFEGICSSEFLVYRCSPNALSRFFQKTLLSANFIKRIDSSTYGSKMPRANSEFIGLQKIPVPPLAEQTAIANFLDQKTAEIDQAIALKTDLIERLKEYKQITIQHAVTRGLDPNAKMKVSGVEWIGDVPKDWKVQKAKFLFTEIDDRSQTGQEELLSVSHTTGVTPRSEKNVNMFLAEDYSGSKLCQPNDLIFNIMWAWMGALGVAKQEGIVSPSYAIYRQIKPNTFHPVFIVHLLKSSRYVEHYNRVSTGLHSSRLRFYSHMFFSMYIGFPSYAEQAAIVAHIEAISAKIDQATDQAQQQINTLTEYKTVLINAAVTGKIKVTDDSAQGTRHAQ